MNIFRLNRFLDPAPGTGAGPSLKDLDNPGATPPPPPTTPPPPPPPPTEGVNPDGTLQEGYIKDAEGNVIKNPELPPDLEGSENELENPEEFWSRVDSLRGEALAIEFPEGMDPLSPEAIIFRDKAIEAASISKWEQHLKQTDPRGYAYLLHRQAGKSDDDFFSQKSFSLPEYSVFKEDADLKVRVYKSSLITKGINELQAQMLVDAAIKDGSIDQLADASYKEAENLHNKQLEAIENANKLEQKKFQDAALSLNNILTEAIDKGNGLNWVIPEADKKEFTNFIRNSVEYDAQTNKFVLVKDLNGDTGRLLEAMFLLYKKGDLSKVVQRQAAAVHAVRLGRAAQRADTRKPGSSGDDPAGDTGKRKPSAPLSALG